MLNYYYKEKSFVLRRHKDSRYPACPQHSADYDATYEYEPRQHAEVPPRDDESRSHD